MITKRMAAGGLSRRSKIEPSYLDRMLTNVVPKFIETDPLGALKFLANELNDIIDKHVAKVLRDRCSRSWRPSVAGAPEYATTSDHTNVLITQLLRASTRTVSQGLIHADELIEILSSYKRSLFRRIELEALLELLPESLPTALKASTKESLFADSDCTVEYWKLLPAVFAHLSARGQRKIYDWIEAGPKEFLAFSDRVSREVRLQMLSAWRRDRLWASRAFLSPRHEDELKGLEEQLGPAEDFTAGNWPRAASFGHEGPLPVDQLASLDALGLIRFLAEWEPPKHFDLHSPSREGAGRQLRQFFSEHPAQILSHMGELKKLEATYLRSIVDGLRDLIRVCAPVDWESALDLAQWVSTQDPTMHYEDATFFARDPSWSWACQSVAHFILDGFQSNECAIPFELRGAVWTVIFNLANFPDPPLNRIQQILETSVQTTQAVR